MGAQWLADAVLYEIYPQSFADSNGDGIGDLRGVIDRLDHLSWLGVDAIWFNPCFESPFVDAGYDVSDYLRIAPRYGTNEDLVELVEQAGRRGIRVLLDLVAGHTSDQHPWFRREAEADGPDPAGDRYVWREKPPIQDLTDHVPGTRLAWVPSPGSRPGFYLKNFYDAQPALNFGWARTLPDEPWRDPVDAPGPRQNREALREILAYWFDRGVAGFRVDMAFSLVKDDADKVETVRLWREIREWMAQEHPDAVLIPEGTEPRTAGSLAFHADFFLVIFEEHASLFDNGSAGRLPFTRHDLPFFDADAAGSTKVFLDGWARARQADPRRPVLLATADHDFNRLRSGSRTAEQLGAALTFLLTWGTVPCIYYGDEIGMRYMPDMPDVEGAICNPAYNRAGCRTPMQWDDSPNAGFSTAEASRLYLPIDPDPARPTVAAQLADPGSTMHLVKRLIELRKATPSLGGNADTRVLNDGYPLVYLRGTTHLVVVNPGREPATVRVPAARAATDLLSSGVEVVDELITVAGFGYGILELSGR